MTWGRFWEKQCFEIRPELGPKHFKSELCAMQVKVGDVCDWVSETSLGWEGSMPHADIGGPGVFPLEESGRSRD